MIAFLIMAIPGAASAGIPDGYCSAPPFVTRNVAPNVMVLMDNSSDMYDEAYKGTPTDPAATDEYVQNETKDNYIGYFIPQACYAYSSKFVEHAKTQTPGSPGPITCNTPNCYTSYTYTDICPSTAPFRGNLLNWATMSRYDVLQKVLIGGNTTSKQGNAHTLESIGSSWSKTYTYNNGANSCVFNVSNASFELTETDPGLCTLLNDPAPSGVAFWFQRLYVRFAGWIHNIYMYASIHLKRLSVFASNAWEKVNLIAQAWAAAAIGTESGTADGYLGQTYSITFVCSGTGSDCPNGIYQWVFTDKPAWLNSTTYTSTQNKTDYKVTVSGAPPAIGNYTFNVGLTIRKESNNQILQTASTSYTIHISAATLAINTGSLPSGGVGELYSTTVSGQGGVSCGANPYAWSATNLPPGLSINSSTGLISGRPTSNSGSPYSVILTMTDCDSPAKSISKILSITISGSSLAITTASLPNGSISSAYAPATLAGSGGSGSGYTWAITSGYLPFGLFLDSSTGVISGNTCPFTSAGANPGVQGNGAGTGPGIKNPGQDGTNPVNYLKTSSFSVNQGLVYKVSSCPASGGSWAGNPFLQLTGVNNYYNDDSAACTFGPEITFTAAGNGTEYVKQSTFGNKKVPAGGGDTLWSYNVIETGTGTQCQGTFNFTVSLTDNTPFTVTKNFSITIGAGALAIDTTSLPDAVKSTPYSVQLQRSGGIAPYTWSATGLPSGLTINALTGVISGTPGANTVGSYNVNITLTGGGTTSTTLPLNVVRTLSLRSQTFNVKVELLEETLVDANGNDIYDSDEPGESFVDLNGNSEWDGKKGIFQEFWDADNPKARWGLTKYTNQGPDVSACVPASPASSFFTTIQNATPSNSAPLASMLYGAINYYKSLGDGGQGTGYRGCNNSEPIDPDVPCRKNFVLVLSSGNDVSGTNFSQNTCSVPNSSAPLVQNACYANSNDLRSDVTGTQLVYTYVVNTMGTLNNAVLQDTAIAGGGKYYDGSNIANLRNQLVQAIQDILSKAASGTAVSVLTTSSRGVGSVVQAYFLPSRQDGTRNIMWTGYMQNIWVDPMDNLRDDYSGSESAAPDKQLDLEKDRIIQMYFNETTKETEAGLFTTGVDGTGGTMASCSNPVVKPFAQVKALWEAGNQLANTAPANRNIFTSSKVLRGSSTVKTITFSINNFLAASFDSDMSAALNPDATYTAGNIISFVRGDCLETVGGGATCTNILDSNYRDRRINGKVWKLGDIISSTPKVLSNTPLNTYHIDYSDATYHSFISSTAYKHRASIALVGANDGMVHAFRVGYLKDTGLSGTMKALFKNTFLSDDTTGRDELGNEVWAYIPYNAFPYLKYLADPSYGAPCHIYFNDLSVRLVDVTTNGAADADKTGSSWETILIGGMRLGGSCSGGTPNGPPTPALAAASVGFSSFFALNVTDPEHPIPLWEFSDADLGYTTSFPTVIRTGPKNKNGNWYVAFGSGPTILARSGTDIGRSSAGNLYILDLKTGNNPKKIPLGHNAIVSDILSVDSDKDYHSEKIYFGTSYLDAGVWKGKIMSIAVPNEDLSSWTPSYTVLFTGNYPFTASPDATKDDKGNIWVYAGSGKYYSDVDEGDASGQIFIGFQDKNTLVVEGASSSCPATPSSCPAGSLCDVTTCTTEGDVGSTVQECMYSGGSFGYQTVVTSVASASIQPKSNIGWKIYLSLNGERVISRPLAVGGLVDFLTYVPSGSLCDFGGDSHLYSVDYTTGLAPKNIAIRAPGATSGTAGTVTVKRSIRLGPGAPPSGEAIILAPQKDTAGNQDKLKKKIQVATGVIVEAENKPIISTSPKFMHWLKK